MSWREQAKFGILSAEHFFLGDGNGGLGTDVTDTIGRIPILGNPYIHYDPFISKPTLVSSSPATPNPIVAPYCQQYSPSGGQGYSTSIIYDNIDLNYAPIAGFALGEDKRSVHSEAKTVICAVPGTGNVGGAGFVDGGWLYGGQFNDNIGNFSPPGGEAIPKRCRIAAKLGGQTMLDGFFGVLFDGNAELTWASPPNSYSLFDWWTQVGLLAPEGSIQALVVSRSGGIYLSGIDGAAGVGPWYWTNQEFLQTGQTWYIAILDVRPILVTGGYGLRWILEIFDRFGGSRVSSGDFIPQVPSPGAGFTPFFYHAIQENIFPIEMATMMTSVNQNDWFDSDGDLVLGYDYPTEWKMKFTSEF
jgi:hypothetical protein